MLLEAVAAFVNVSWDTLQPWLVGLTHPTGRSYSLARGRRKTLRQKCQNRSAANSLEGDSRAEDPDWAY